MLRLALLFLVIALIDVWAAVYYFAYGRSRMNDANPADDNTTWFWVAGFFLTGLVLIVLGLVLGPLGRAARESELPPKETTREEAQIKTQAAANPNPAVANQATGLTPPAPQPPAQTGYAQPTT